MSIIALVRDSIHYNNDNKPILSFSLFTINDDLYLSIKNTGKSTAHKIDVITIDTINNDFKADEKIFGEPFMLSPEEIIQNYVAPVSKTEKLKLPALLLDVTYEEEKYDKLIKYMRKVSCLR